VGTNRGAPATVISHRQLELLDLAVVTKAFEIDDDGAHGEVFTRRWVVELILDLVGYKAERPLHDLVLVEPSCGSGAFLGVVAERVSAACRRHGVDLLAAKLAVRAFDLLPRNVEVAKVAVRSVLLADGWAEVEVSAAVDAWISSADFLLGCHEVDSADFVVGNPPYIRLEDLPDDRNAAYRRAWPTMAGRSDIYVGFIEKGLALLRPDGRLGYICADRWMRNQYGSALRELVASTYSVDAVVSMHDVDAFEAEVSAYPAVTVLANTAQREAVVVETNRNFGESAARDFVRFAAQTEQKTAHTASFSAARLPHWFSGRDSWPQGSPERIAMLEYLADRFPPLEDATTGTRVGIGVASGADGVFVVPG
jgi:adenine-specific DNA-methyltransferase